MYFHIFFKWREVRLESKFCFEIKLTSTDTEKKFIKENVQLIHHFFRNSHDFSGICHNYDNAQERKCCACVCPVHDWTSCVVNHVVTCSLTHSLLFNRWPPRNGPTRSNYSPKEESLSHLRSKIFHCRKWNPFLSCAFFCVYSVLRLHFILRRRCSITNLEFIQVLLVVPFSRFILINDPTFTVVQEHVGTCTTLGLSRAAHSSLGRGWGRPTRHW